jgi:general secretion pathway protein F
MPDFLVRTLEPRHGVRERRVQAAHAQAVPTALGLAPHQVLQVQAVAPRWWTPKRRAPALDLRLLTQELAVLLQAGVPLIEALQTLREQGASATVLDAVVLALQQGQPLSAAMGEHPTHFDGLTCALVAASERNGQLAPTLAQHAAYLAWSQALRAKLVAAALYPLMLVGASWAVLVFLLLYVLPRFAGVFEGLGRELPWASQALLNAGQAAAAQPLFTLALAVGLPTAAVLAWRHPRSQAALAAALWRVPALGARLRVLALARLYRCLALLLQAGVPALPALGLAQAVLPAALRTALALATQQVAQGQRLSAALQAQGLATPVALRMLRVGEHSGELPAMLARAAAFHDEELARLSELVTRTVNPVLMLVMGVLIGGIVVLMYLPIFSLMEQVQ